MDAERPVPLETKTQEIRSASGRLRFPVSSEMTLSAIREIQKIKYPAVFVIECAKRFLCVDAQPFRLGDGWIFYYW